MQRCIYEVRGTNDPIDGDSVCFELKADALDYAKDFPEAEIYCICADYDDYNGPEGFCLDKKEYKLDKCGNFCEESLEVTVDQDLSDNRQPMQAYELEYDEPVDGNAFRKHEHGITESYNKQVSVDDFRKILESDGEFYAGNVDDGWVDCRFDDGGVYSDTELTVYYDLDELDPYSIKEYYISDDGGVCEGYEETYETFEDMLDALKERDFIECFIKF